MEIYFYGIIEAERGFNFDHVGIANGRIYTIQYKDIEAVVNQVPENYKIGLEDTFTYEGVLRRVMENGAIIPMSFGTVVKEPAEIQKILKRGYMVLKHMMDNIRGKLQVNVTASWNEKAVLKTILVEDRELSTLRKKIVKNPANQNLRIELGRRVKKALDEKRREIVPAMITTLQGLSDDFEENKIKDMNTILNASFLLEKSREQDFYAKADEMERRYAKEIKLLVVGPVPPYNFTRIEVKNVDFEAVKEAQKILGLDEELNISEISQAFNHLAQSYHPDLHSNDPTAAEKFGRIRKAHDVLIEYCEHRLFSFTKSDIEDTLIIRERSLALTR